MKKAELRKLYLERRKALSKEEVLALSERIFEMFVLNFPVSEHQNVHIFISIPKFNEVETTYFINYFRTRNVRVFVPKMINNSIISVEMAESTKMVTNSWGISEPAANVDSGCKQFDYVITPLLYCDRKGNRVGYGKGFYDRFFSEIKATKIGVGFFRPNVPVDDINESDIALDYLVTPDEMVSFKGLL